MNRIYLYVDYSQKNIAKAAGARWDDNKRSWYYPTREPAGSAALSALPEDLHKFAPANPEIVRDPYIVQKERIEGTRIRLRQMLDEEYDAVLKKLQQAPLKAYQPSWGGEEDAVLIRTDFLQKFAESGKAETLVLINEAVDFNPKADDKKHMAHMFNRSVRNQLNECTQIRWETVTTPYHDHYFDCLDALDLDKLPYGDLQTDDGDLQTDEKFVQGELEIEFFSSDHPEILSIRHKGELIYHHREKSRITYGGKFIRHAFDHPKLRETKRQIIARHHEAVKALLADVIVADDAKRTVSGENYTIQTTDGRIITGFTADDEYYIYTLDGKPVGSAPEKDALCGRIREVFKQTA